MSLHLIMGCMYSGKCYPEYTSILTPDGTWKYANKFTIGDKIEGLDGKPKRVLNINRSYCPCYLIEHLMGTLVVSENHQLVLMNNGKVVAKYAYEIEDCWRQYSLIDIHKKCIPIFAIKTIPNMNLIGLEVEDNYVILENYIVGHNSSHLIHEVSKYKTVGEKVLCINSIYDSRSDDEVIMTHDRVSIESLKVLYLSDVDVPPGTTTIGIDEAQFFSDLVPWVKTQLALGRRLIVAGLDGDFRQSKFGSITDLIPIADTYEKKYAICHICQQRPGVFTKRFVDSDQQILVGARESYIATCRKCLNA